MEFFRKGFPQTSKEESSNAAHWGLAIPWQVSAGVVAYGTSGSWLCLTSFYQHHYKRFLLSVLGRCKTPAPWEMLGQWGSGRSQAGSGVPVLGHRLPGSPLGCGAHGAHLIQAWRSEGAGYELLVLAAQGDGTVEGPVSLLWSPRER